ncbi:MAG: hypothetical protein ACI9MR_004365 [Myxococcota bacterium]|jgi:hypothetical protein
MDRSHRQLVLVPFTCAALLGCVAQQQHASTDRPEPSATVSCQGADYLTMAAGDLQFTWNKQVNCLTAPARGSFRAEIIYRNPAESGEIVELATLALQKITPRPAMDRHLHAVGPLEGTLAVATKLPITLAPGEQTIVALTGRFILDADEDGSMRANFHLKMRGTGATSGKALAAGTTLHLLSAAEREPNGGGRENAAGYKEEQRQLGTPEGEHPPPDPD